MALLGEKVVDSISGFMGIATARMESLWGFTKIHVEPFELRDGVPVEPQWFEEQRLVSLSEAESKAAGPGPAVPSQDTPAR